MKPRRSKSELFAVLAETYHELALLEAADAAQHTPAPPAEWLTRKEAARHLGISENTVRKLVLAGTLRTYPFGGITRYKRTELDACASARP